ncbi:hypothetical protein D3C72_1945910 [compost metagenome]
MIPAEGDTLVIADHLYQQGVVVGVEEMRAVGGACLEIDIVECQPDLPVDVFGDLRAAVGAEIQQHGVAQALQGAYFRMFVEILRRADRVDHVVHQGVAAISLADPGHLGDEDVGAHTRFHGQEVLRGDQVEVDVRVRAEET